LSAKTAQPCQLDANQRRLGPILFGGEVYMFGFVGGSVAAALFLAGAPAQDQEQAKPKREKKICKADQAATGTRMGRPTICRTAAQWEALERDAAMEFQARAQEGSVGFSGQDASKGM
jgi:hypothetical protein